MGRLKSGMVYVGAYPQNPGYNKDSYPAYDLVGVVFADVTGTLSVFDVQIGWIIFAQAYDVDTAAPLPGILHKYKIIDISNQDGGMGTFDCTILWDEGGGEVDAPLEGFNIPISEVVNGFCIPVPAELYSNAVGGSVAAQSASNFGIITIGSGAVLIDGSIATRMINAVGSVGIGFGIISFGNDGFILADNTIPGREETLGVTLDVTGSGQYCRILLNGAAKDVFAPGQFPDNDILCQGSAGELVVWDNVPNTPGQDEVISIGQTFGSGRHFVFRKQYYTNI